MTPLSPPPPGRRTEDLPAYVDHEPASRRDDVGSFHREVPTATVLAGLWVVFAPVLLGAAAVVGGSAGAVGVAVFAAMAVAGAMELTAARGRRRRPDLARCRIAEPVLWNLSASSWRRRWMPLVAGNVVAMVSLGGLAAFARAGPMAIRSVAPPFDRPSALAALVAGVALVQALNGVVGVARLRRVERRTGTWVVAVRLPRRWGLSTSYAADGLVVAGTSWRVTLPAPLAACDVATFPPLGRWAVLMATGRLDEALALAGAQHRGGEPEWAGWAAVTLVVQGRLDEAERWVQRSVDAGYHGEIDPAVARVLAPLHRSAAWRALMVQTRSGRGTARRFSPRRR